MKKKIFLGIFLTLAIIGLIYMIVINTVFNKNEEIINEYIPEVEISDSELRKTLVTLYFVDNENNIKSETRLIDSKELLRNPYLVLVNMLIDGPKDKNLKSVISKDTKVIDANINKNCVTINLSKEFVDNADSDVNQKSKMINTIVNTLTELNEVQTVKFLIDGEETEGFQEDSIKLTSEFARIKTEN